jgi:hypothetical protein
VEKNKFTIAIPVWGAEKLKVFSYISLVSLLKELVDLSAEKLMRINLHLYTDEYGMKVLESMKSVHSISRLIQVQYKIINTEGQAYNILTECHKRVISEASNGEYISMQVADYIYGDGALIKILEYIDCGVDFLYMATLRLNIEEVVRRHDFFIDPVPNYGLNYSINNSKEYILELINDCPHEITTLCNYENEKGNGNPSHVYFKYMQTIIAHCFHLHPILIKKNEKLNNNYVTIDGDLIGLDEFKKMNTVVIQSSDDLLIAELTASRIRGNPTGQKLTFKQLQSWVPATTTELHRYFFTIPIRFGVTNNILEKIHNNNYTNFIKQ